MSKVGSANADSKKSPYSAPRLTVYGSVRNLTGGGSAGTTDGGGNMAPKPL